MIAGVCFLLLVSLTASAVITAVGGYLEHLLRGSNLFRVRYQHCFAALRDDLQVSTRREALLLRQLQRDPSGYASRASSN
jgi:hypothetical protein